ncbi:MAG: class I SAM-dependent methyltransferase [Burkholderiales bacterium]|nr:class I SAM-dependent methyltransferase [Burkholderiales bacterium]
MKPSLPALVHRVAAPPWPLPALLAWGAGWAAWRLAQAAGAGVGPALAAGTLAGVALALVLIGAGVRRRLIAALGFPLSAAALGAVGGWPAWAWLLLLLPLLAAYPLRAWADAPLFPTPAGALQGLAAQVAAPRRALDAGCGLGHGLLALRALWPQAELQGLEWSAPLAWAAARRCPFAQVRRADMWATPWAGHDLVYLFQRPESMARAYAKARRELAPGAWLVSLEFAVPDAPATACLQGPGRRPLWLYRMPGAAAAAALRSTMAAGGR